MCYIGNQGFDGEGRLLFSNDISMWKEVDVY